MNPASIHKKDYITDIRIETEQEEDGRWLAEVIGLPGVMAYGTSRLQAMAKAETLAFRTLAVDANNEQLIKNLTIGVADLWPHHQPKQTISESRVQVRMCRWLEANPDDELVKDIRAKLASEPERYAAYTREYLGWGVFALMPR